MTFLDSAALYDQYTTSSNECYLYNRPYYLTDYVDLYMFSVTFLVIGLTTVFYIIACVECCDIDEVFEDIHNLDPEEDTESLSELELNSDKDSDDDDSSYNSDDDDSSDTTSDYDSTENELTEDETSISSDDDSSDDDSTDEDDSSDDDSTVSVVDHYEVKPVGLKRRRKV